MPSPLKFVCEITSLNGNVIMVVARIYFIPPKGWRGDLESKYLADLKLRTSHISCNRLLELCVSSIAFLVGYLWSDNTEIGWRKGSKCADNQTNHLRSPGLVIRNVDAFGIPTGELVAGVAPVLFPKPSLRNISPLDYFNSVVLLVFPTVGSSYCCISDRNTWSLTSGVESTRKS